MMCTQGTSSTRFIIYDEKLNKVASHQVVPLSSTAFDDTLVLSQVEVFQKFPEPG